ncbi:hypothetical protein AGDE_12598 [Angomonas deanei]|nr:hypothetical protein AGDE_12598 [Angomonas deanei]|eukprot:EPY23962.1 hypothetical protein AGDE_12598 [Angomonas deanei]
MKLKPTLAQKQPDRGSSLSYAEANRNSGRSLVLPQSHSVARIPVEKCVQPTSVETDFSILYANHFQLLNGIVATTHHRNDHHPDLYYFGSENSFLEHKMNVFYEHIYEKCITEKAGDAMVYSFDTGALGLLQRLDNMLSYLEGKMSCAGQLQPYGAPSQSVLRLPEREENLDEVSSSSYHRPQSKLVLSYTHHDHRRDSLVCTSDLTNASAADPITLQCVLHHARLDYADLRLLRCQVEEGLLRSALQSEWGLSWHHHSHHMRQALHQEEERKKEMDAASHAGTLAQQVHQLRQALGEREAEAQALREERETSRHNTEELYERFRNNLEDMKEKLDATEREKKEMFRELQELEARVKLSDVGRRQQVSQECQTALYLTSLMEVVQRNRIEKEEQSTWIDLWQYKTQLYARQLQFNQTSQHKMAFRLLMQLEVAERENIYKEEVFWRRDFFYLYTDYQREIQSDRWKSKLSFLNRPPVTALPETTVPDRETDLHSTPAPLIVEPTGQRTARAFKKNTPTRRQWPLLDESHDVSFH